MSTKPTYDRDGVMIAGIEIITDYTPQKMAELALQESEGRYRALFEHMSDGVAYIKPGMIGKISPLRRLKLSFRSKSSSEKIDHYTGRYGTDNTFPISPINKRRLIVGRHPRTMFFPGTSCVVGVICFETTDTGAGEKSDTLEGY